MELLSVRNLETSFTVRNSTMFAVKDVSFTLNEGETIGVVGESGSGKSVLCLSIMRLVPEPPGKISGVVEFRGKDLIGGSEQYMNSVRGHRMAMVFQDPSTSLNPYMRISEQLIEPLRIHRKISRADALNAAITALNEVGIADASRRIRCYPHEFSGGMRQRVMIAMALVTHPKLLIADEPTTALDVTVQAQIINLLNDLQERYHMSILFVTHNLGVVTKLCDRVMVMYAGRVLESASTIDLFKETAHPYTRALIHSLPVTHDSGEALYGIKGMPPDPLRLPPGCPFAPRCESAVASCEKCDCTLKEISAQHSTACCRFVKGEISL